MMQKGCNNDAITMQWCKRRNFAIMQFSLRKLAKPISEDNIFDLIEKWNKRIAEFCSSSHNIYMYLYKDYLFYVDRKKKHMWILTNDVLIVTNSHVVVLNTFVKNTFPVISFTWFAL